MTGANKTSGRTLPFLENSSWCAESGTICLQELRVRTRTAYPLDQCIQLVTRAGEIEDPKRPRQSHRIATESLCMPDCGRFYVRTLTGIALLMTVVATGRASIVRADDIDPTLALCSCRPTSRRRKRRLRTATSRPP